MNTDLEDTLAIATHWHADGEDVAIATVTETWGSSPRPAGSQMAVTKSGRMAGSVSGGCIEGAVADAAMQTLENNTPQLLDFGITNERAWEVGLACGGKLKVFVERLTPLPALTDAKSSGRPVVLATSLPGGTQHLLPDPTAPAAWNSAARTALLHDKNSTVEIDGQPVFLHVHNPPLRLAIVGAVHVAQALVPFAAALGLSVTVIDPRRAFATDERFPSLSVSTAWPDEAMDHFAPDTRSAIVTLTHDPKLDDPALDRALRSPAFYIGALGSRKTHAARCTRLRELGHDDAALARIRGPVGLDIGAVTASEIALSIIAEIIAARRGAALAVKA